MGYATAMLSYGFYSKWPERPRECYSLGMAVHLQKRRTSTRGIMAVCAVLLLSSLSPCFALCTAAREAAKPAPKAAVPSCHKAPAAPAAQTVAAPGAPTCSEKPSASRCCCLTERSAKIPADDPIATATRDAAPSALAHFEYILATNNPLDDAHLLRIHADRSPPGTPVFIAHHALLI